MRLIPLVLTVLILSCILAHSTRADSITAYPQPSIYPASTVFSLTANGNPIPVTDFSKQYDYAAFTLNDGPCNLEITRLDGTTIEKHSISPLKYQIVGTTAGSKLSFKIEKPSYLIIEIDKLRRLVIAIDPPESDKPAASGAGIFNIAADPYKADGSGQSSCTAAIQKAIDDAANDPGKHGIVYVPDGVYLSANLQLKSNVSLYLQSGAVLRCSGKRDDFPVLFEKLSQHRKGTWFISTEANSNNVKIYGRGTIDGDGKAMIKNMNFLNHVLVPMGCSHFTMDGPILRDSGLWGTVVARCNHVLLQNTKHLNFLDMGEDDGIDLCESQDVLLKHVLSISLDDSFSFKTWSTGTDIQKSWAGSPEPLRNNVLDDCFAWSRCFAFKVGAGVNQPEDGITVRNSVVYDAAHGIGISHSYGSGDVRNILFDTIDIERCTTDCLGQSWARFVIDKRKGDETAGNVFDVRLQNINVRDAGKMPVPIQGLSDDKMIHSITFNRIYMPGKTSPATTLEEIGVKETKFADGITVQR